MPPSFSFSKFDSSALNDLQISGDGLIESKIQKYTSQVSFNLYLFDIRFLIFMS